MPILLRIVAAIAAVSVIFTIALIVMLVGPRGLRPLLETGPLGIFTLVGWVITLAAGPIAAVRLWQLRQSGRLAGLVLFGFGILYYVAGLIWLRAPEAQTTQILMAVAGYSVPFIILAVPAARRACS